VSRGSTGPIVSFPPGFGTPDTTLPFDVAAAIAAVPPTATAKGLFLQPIVDACAANGTPIRRGPYIPFKDYPRTELIALLIDAGEQLFAEHPVRERIRRLGLGSYDRLEATLVGRVVFGVLGKDIRAIARRAPKAFEISGTGLTAEVLATGDNHSHLALCGDVVLATDYEFGAFQGVLRFCGVTGEVRLREISRERVEFFTIWNPT
jgi:uncharacterized protein (TIGR02265 family)